MTLHSSSHITASCGSGLSLVTKDNTTGDTLLVLAYDNLLPLVKFYQLKPPVILTCCMAHQAKVGSLTLETDLFNRLPMSQSMHLQLRHCKCLTAHQQAVNLCSAALVEQLAAVKQQCARQHSRLADAQASCTHQTQALEQQLSTKQSEHKAALQLLDGAKQSIAQLQAECQRQSDRAAELESKLGVSQESIASAKAELARQQEKTAGIVPVLCIPVHMCHEQTKCGFFSKLAFVSAGYSGLPTFLMLGSETCTAKSECPCHI